MDQLGVVEDTLIAHSAHMVPSTSDLHSTSRVEEDDTEMMSLEGDGSYPFTEERGSFSGQ